MFEMGDISEEELVALDIVPLRNRLREAGISDGSDKWCQLMKRRRTMLNRAYAAAKRERDLEESKSLQNKINQLNDEINKFQTEEELNKELKHLEQECEFLKQQCRWSV